MATEASAPIPPPQIDDDEDVNWALSTASALWGRGERAEALKWLRRAAEQASDANADVRALQLFKAAADVASKMNASSPPPAQSTAPPPAAPQRPTQSPPGAQPMSAPQPGSQMPPRPPPHAATQQIPQPPPIAHLQSSRPVPAPVDVAGYTSDPRSGGKPYVPHAQARPASQMPAPPKPGTTPPPQPSPRGRPPERQRGPLAKTQQVPQGYAHLANQAAPPRAPTADRIEVRSADQVPYQTRGTESAPLIELPGDEDNLQTGVMPPAPPGALDQVPPPQETQPGMFGAGPQHPGSSKPRRSQGEVGFQSPMAQSLTGQSRGGANAPPPASVEVRTTATPPTPIQPTVEARSRSVFGDDEVTMQHNLHMFAPRDGGGFAGQAGSHVQAPASPQAPMSGAPRTAASPQMTAESASARSGAAHADHDAKPAPSAPRSAKGQRFDDLDDETRVLDDEPPQEGGGAAAPFDDAPQASGARSAPRPAPEDHGIADEPTGIAEASQQPRPIEVGSTVHPPRIDAPVAFSPLESVIVAVVAGDKRGEARVILLEPGTMPPDGTAMSILVPMSEMDGAALRKLFGG